MSRDVDETELVARAVDGDKAALEEEICLLQDPLYRLALRMVRRPSDADDATQEILIRVITRLAAWRGEAKLLTWAYRVGVNYPVNLRRGSSAEATSLSFDLEARAVEKIVLTRSFRSSPAVLAAVNALAEAQGRPALRCADPSDWDETAQLSTKAFATLHDEAAFIAAHVAPLLLAPGLTVGVLARSGQRLSALRATLDEPGIAFSDWSAPLGDARMLMDLRREYATAVATASNGNGDPVALLEQRCHDLQGENDLEGRDAVSEACAALRDLMK